MDVDVEKQFSNQTELNREIPPATMITKNDVAGDLAELFKGFSKLSREERLQALKQFEILDKSEVEYLERGGLKDTSLGETSIS